MRSRLVLTLLGGVELAGFGGLILTPGISWSLAGVSALVCLLATYGIIREYLWWRDAAGFESLQRTYNVGAHVLAQSVVILVGLTALALSVGDVLARDVGTDSVLLALVGAYCVYGGVADMPSLPASSEPRSGIMAATRE